MISKKIILSLVGLCFVSGLTFGAYKVGGMASTPKVSPQKQETPISAHATQSLVTSDNASTIAPTPTPVTKGEQIQLAKPGSTPPNTDKGKMEDTFNKLFADGKLIEAKEGGVYPTKKVVAVNKSVLFTVEGNRTADPDMLLTPGRYYAVIDFSIVNLQNKPYFSNFSNFVLKDSLGYTFTPVSAEGTVGDISGEVLSGFPNMKRGEIAFAVPTNEQGFILQVETGLNTKCINFTINAISPNLAWPKPYN